MPNTVNQSHFAKMCGVSRQAISKAKDKKPPLLKMIGKHVNLDHRITCEYYFAQTGRQLRPESVDEAPPAKKPPPAKASKPNPAATPSTKTPATKKKTKKAAVQIGDDTPDPELNPDIDLDELDYENGYALPKGIKCFEDITIHNLHTIPGDLVKKVKELEVAKKAKQDRDAKRGELIEREVVFKFISQLYVIDVNQIKTQEDRLVPGLCGVFGVEVGSPESIEARKLIKNDSADLLESIQREVNDYLSGISPKK